MFLRQLEEKDIPGMLEWMHDPAINQFFRFDADAMDRDKVLEFVTKARLKDRKNIQLACVNEDDTYLGTISLKDINRHDQTAEYAISFRAAAHGTGAARYATQEILRIAFSEENLCKVYLNVLSENTHAWNFYEKQGFRLEGILRQHILVRNKRHDLRLYGMLKEDWEQIAASNKPMK